MTRQPTIQLGIHLPMTADAKAHLKFYGMQAIHVLHLPMALRAVQTGPFNVGKVIEVNEIRHPENSDPGHRFFLPVMLLFLEDLGMMRNDVFMAEKTFFHGRKAGIQGSFDEGMAEPAVDLLHPGMDPMAEIDRLLRAETLSGETVIEIEHGRDEQDDPAHQKIAMLRSEPTLFHQIPLGAALRRFLRRIKIMMIS
jgi:hypothetical protein